MADDERSRSPTETQTLAALEGRISITLGDGEIEVGAGREHASTARRISLPRRSLTRRRCWFSRSGRTDPAVAVQGLDRSIRRELVLERVVLVQTR